MKYLGVFATKDEIESVRCAINRPIMVFTNPKPPGPGVPATIPFGFPPEVVAHRCALQHGLPETDGLIYGLDLRTGEFVSAEVETSD